MAGYTRQASSNIADGQPINAQDFNDEYNAIQTAFSKTGGHSHDPSNSDSGAPIEKVGPAGEITVGATTVTPSSANSMSLGTTAAEWGNVYIGDNSGVHLGSDQDGLLAYNSTSDKIELTGEELRIANATNTVEFRNANTTISSSTDTKLDIDATGEIEIVAPTVDIDASTAMTIDTATLTITGATNVTGDLDIDNININGNTIISTNTDGNIVLTPNGTGEVDISKVDIDSGAIDGTTIGASSESTGAFTTLTASTSVSTDTINEKTAGAGVTIDSVFLKDDVVNATDVEVSSISANDGTESATIANTTGIMTIASSVLTTTDINGGTIDDTPIGATTKSTGAFSSIVLNAGATVTAINDTDDMSDASDTTLATSESIKAYVDAVDTDVVNDTTPQLGGDLDVNGNSIVSTSNGNITLAPNGTGKVVVSGSLQVDGTTTTVNSETVTVDDPVFTLGGDTAPSTDDNRDRGIEFRYHTGSSAKVGFFGFDDSEGKFTFIPDATNTSEVFSGTAGTIVADIEGDVTGNLTGNVTGNVTGDVTGDVTGNVSGDVTGNITGNITSSGTSEFSGTINLTGTTNVDTINEKTSDSGVTIDGVLLKDKSIAVKDSTTNTVTIDAPSSVTSYTLTLPAAAPSVDSVIEVDSSGNSSFTTKSSLFAPTGVVSAFAGSTAPTGYLICNGSAISRTTYSDLFTVIGTTYGAGDGSTTFNIPDLRGYFVRGLDTRSSGNVDPYYNENSNTIRPLGSTQGDALQNHAHDDLIVDGWASDGQAADGSSHLMLDASGNAGKTVTTVSTGNVSGASTSSETRPINIAMNYIIKT